MTTIHCAECQQPFETEYPDRALYCSEQCYRIARRAKQNPVYARFYKNEAKRKQRKAEEEARLGRMLTAKELGAL